jgi:hypothetical protein
MIRDAGIRGSLGFRLRRHRRRILTWKLDFREERLPGQDPREHTPHPLARYPADSGGKRCGVRSPT